MALDPCSSGSKSSPDGGCSPQRVIALDPNKRPGDGGTDSTSVLEEQVRHVPVVGFVQQLDGSLDVGAFPTRLEPSLGVVEDRVGSLEMLQYEVRLGGTFLDEILAAPVRIL